MEYQVLIMAAGSSSRSKLNYNKIFYKIQDKTIIELATNPFLNDKDCKKVVLVIKKEDELKLREIFNDKVSYVYGGNTRQESVKLGLNKIDSKYVLIHDGARPHIDNKFIDRIKENLVNHDCVIPVIDLTDSIKKVNDNYVVESLNRNDYKLVQTPQGFLTSQIKKAHELASNQDYNDDSMMVEQLLNKPVYCIPGDIKNQKYTNQEDF